VIAVVVVVIIQTMLVSNFYSFLSLGALLILIWGGGVGLNLI